MKITDEEIHEIQEKYHYFGNYEAEDPDAPIDPLTYIDSNGDALLHIAARLGDQRTVELLLNAGVDVNLVGDMGNTALHYASTQEIKNLLLARGASVEIYNEFGNQPTGKI